MSTADAVIRIGIATVLSNIVSIAGTSIGLSPSRVLCTIFRDHKGVSRSTAAVDLQFAAETPQNVGGFRAIREV